MHDRRADHPTTHQEEARTPTSAGASWRFGHSPAEGASEPAPAPGVAGLDRRQGAPVEKAATEGGSQHAQSGRTAGRRRSRPRDRKQRPAHSVRLNEHELALVRQGADRVGMSVAAFLAYSALAAARDQTRTAEAIATDRDVLTALFGVRRQLGWAGSNVNQMARALNAGADVPHFAEVLGELRRAAHAVQQAADRVADRQQDSAA
ncbi:plasmid mobilization relaxosome protein MobC [Streptomyces albus]|nr:plasmid mobilization relaxosome protein MobC [Streptomyces albus]